MVQLNTINYSNIEHIIEWFMLYIIQLQKKEKIPFWSTTDKCHEYKSPGCQRKINMIIKRFNPENFLNDNFNQNSNVILYNHVIWVNKNVQRYMFTPNNLCTVINRSLKRDLSSISSCQSSLFPRRSDICPHNLKAHCLFSGEISTWSKHLWIWS